MAGESDDGPSHCADGDCVNENGIGDVWRRREEGSVGTSGGSEVRGGSHAVAVASSHEGCDEWVEIADGGGGNASLSSGEAWVQEWDYFSLQGLGGWEVIPHCPGVH